MTENNKKPLVQIIVGSGSDSKFALEVESLLHINGITSNQEIFSAHKNTQELLNFLASQTGKYPLVYVAIAGKTDDLGGIVAANTKKIALTLPYFRDEISYLIDIHSSFRLPSNIPSLVNNSPSGIATAIKRIIDTFARLYSNSLESMLGKELANGKTKVIYDYENTECEKTVLMFFKDDLTAGDGKKKDTIDGIGKLKWQINKIIFELLNKQKIPTAYCSSPEECYTKVLLPDEILKFEIVSRRVATGSILDEGYIEGDFFPDLEHEAFTKGKKDYKIDKRKYNKEPFLGMFELNAKVFEILEKQFLQSGNGYQLIDLKLEYGLFDNQLKVVDSIEPDSWRLWATKYYPYEYKKRYEKAVEISKDLEVNKGKVNILGLLNKENMLDKQPYRNGAPSEEVLRGYEKVAELVQHPSFWLHIK